MTDQELKDLVASLAISGAKTDAKIAEVAAQQKLTEQQIKETAIQQKLTEKQIKETAIQQKRTEEQLAKTDAQLAKTDAQLAKTDEKLQRVGVMLGGIAQNQGDVAEEFFINSIIPTLTVAGVQYDMLHKNMSRSTKVLNDEFDIVLVNGKELLIIETKYKAHTKDLEKLIDKKHQNFQKLYPEYQNYTQKLALASFYIGDDLKNQALENGVMILKRKGDLIEVDLPRKKPLIK